LANISFALFLIEAEDRLRISMEAINPFTFSPFWKRNRC